MQIQLGSIVWFNLIGGIVGDWSLWISKHILPASRDFTTLEVLKLNSPYLIPSHGGLSYC